MDWGSDMGYESFCTLVTFVLSSLGHGGGGREKKMASNHLGKVS